MTDLKIKVGEMFAGVGGFHLGLQRASLDYEVVWADQYEPGRANQFAFNIYKNNFPNTNVSNEDIMTVNKNEIPHLNLLVGGFPCQDYSVATSGAEGLYGKKGVLWWDIKEVVEAKWPEFMLFENVDRLLASPGVKSKNAGRDFGIILRTLSELGYGVSWKVINAADYGYPQRRRRTFIFAFRSDTKFKKDIETIVHQSNDQTIEDFILKMAPFSDVLKNQSVSNVNKVDISEKHYKDLLDFSHNFATVKGFQKTGFMVNGEAYMADYVPKEVKRSSMNLGDILDSKVAESLFLSTDQESKFRKLKEGFQTIKTSRNGDYQYKYGMGKMAFPDLLDKPARTMVTSEHTISRMSHVVADPNRSNRLRVISPEEAEKINTFPVGWTNLEGVTDSNRYFTMGNALVVDLVKDIGKSIRKIINNETLNSQYANKHTVEKVIH